MLVRFKLICIELSFNIFFAICLLYVSPGLWPWEVWGLFMNTCS